ncbi:hypothetical protein [Streptomyces anthocyanicus]|uniref:hypothetical protein n=1 Tax=Streptomyces anthocyanicus TaxID=68174 RepID=UPI00382A90F9
MTLFIHRNAGGRCPCGAEDATCGPPSSVVPVDQLIEEVPAVSGPLKKYRVTRNGVETLMKLSDADAKRLGLGVDQAADAASTIEPVELADDGAQEAQQPSTEAPAEADTAAPPETPESGEQREDTSPAASEPKTPAKRRTGAANKARTAATTANKAADGGN